MYHGACVEMSKADIECITSDSLPWRCPPCAKSRRASMRFESQLTEGSLTLEDVMKKVMEILQNNKDIEQNVNKSYEALSDKLEENTQVIKEQTASLERCLKTIDGLAAENNKLKEKILNLETRLDDVEQYSRRNTLEIYGIPQTANEDVVTVVKEVGKALNMGITNTMIDACHRMGKVKPDSPPPGIIVKFVRRIDMEEMLNKKRVKKELSTRHMNLGTDFPIYINESLSPSRRRLFAAARIIKKDKHFKYLWTRGGNIFLRKEDSAPVVKVTCQADLDGF